MDKSNAHTRLQLVAGRTRPIFRVRTGCLRCRQRKKKCDEVKPICRACKRNELQCEWPSNVVQPKSGMLSRLEPRRLNAQERHIQEKSTSGGEETCGSQDFGRTKEASLKGMDLEDMDICEVPGLQDENSLTALSISLALSPTDSTSTTDSNDSSPQLEYHCLQNHSSPNLLPSGTGYMQSLRDDESSAPFENEVECFSSLSMIPAGEKATSARNVINDKIAKYQSPTLPRAMSLLPEYGQEAFELLSHYLSRTAESMSNGFSPSNPFLSQLVPLAMSSDIILRLILTQSAAHRAVLHAPQNDNVASGHYGKSVKLFRRRINDHIGGTSVDPLMLAVGALIMCFTEVWSHRSLNITGRMTY
jgi:Fungal specific transcription factor domain/Fungal Zn(2)-Cys(6) binuclear cluster domain